MSIAILTRPYCKSASLTFFYFLLKGKRISLFIVESELRRKFTKSQDKFHKAHDQLAKYELNPCKKSSKYIVSLILYYIVLKITNFFNLLFWDNIHTFQKLFRFSIDYTERHSSGETVSSLKINSISYALLTSSQWILTNFFLNSINTKIINIHPGRLPKDRSLDSNPRAILRGDPPFLSSHIIDAGIDTGPIIKKSKVRIFDQDFFSFIEIRYNWLKTIEFFDSWQLLKRGCSLYYQSIKEGTHHNPMPFEELRKASDVIQKFKHRNIRIY